MGEYSALSGLQVYEAAMEEAMEIIVGTKAFSEEERHAIVDQVRRSSRSILVKIAEAWRRRRSSNHFQSKLGDAESEAEETRVWIEFAYRCGYLDAETGGTLMTGTIKSWAGSFA